MKKILSLRCVTLMLLTALLLLVFNSNAMACAACYGDTSGSKMSDAASVGIFAMVVIMFAMLGTIFLVGWYLAWRAKNPLPDYEELLSDDKLQPNPGTSS